MRAESKPGLSSASHWATRLWGAALAGLVLCWVVWGALAFVKLRQSPRIVQKRTADGQVIRQVWKRPAYGKFTTFSQAISEAKRLKRPIFLDLYADWCVPCKKLERETFAHPTVHPVMARYVAAKFNVDFKVGKQLARRFRVRYYPTTLMLNSDGSEIERVIGFYPPRYYRPVLVSVLKGEGHYRDLLARYRRNRNDLEVMLQLATRSILRRKIKQARDLYQIVWQKDKDGKLGFGPRALFGIARSHSRISNYKQALPYLKTFFQRFPAPGMVHREALRLQLYCLQRLRRNPELNQARMMFRRLYPEDSPKYK